MRINARKISFPRLKQCLSLYQDFRRELAWTQVHCFIFFSPLHIYISTCKHTDSIYNLVIVCLHICYHKNSIKSIKFKVHFCLEKCLFKIFGQHFFPFFQLKHSTCRTYSYTTLPSGQAKLVIFLFMWVSNKEEKTLKIGKCDSKTTKSCSRD